MRPGLHSSSGGRLVLGALCLALLAPILTGPGLVPGWDPVIRVGALAGPTLACLAQWGVLRNRAALGAGAVAFLGLGFLGLGVALGVRLTGGTGEGQTLSLLGWALLPLMYAAVLAWNARRAMSVPEQHRPIRIPEPSAGSSAS